MGTHYFQIKDYKSTSLQGVFKHIQLQQQVKDPQIRKIIFIPISIQTLFNKVAAFKAITVPLASCF